MYIHCTLYIYLPAHQSTVVTAMLLFQLLNGGCDSRSEKETSLGHVAMVAVLQQGLVPNVNNYNILSLKVQIHIAKSGAMPIEQGY